MIQGSTFELYVTVREATPVQGGQYILGGEFPLHYQGLANGVRATVSPGNASGLAGGAATAGGGTATGVAGVASAVAGAVPGSSAQPNCVPAGQGGQNAASTIADTTNAAGSQNQQAADAASQVSSAVSAISSLGSLFHKKAAPANATTAQNTTGLPPCPPGSTGDGSVPQAAGGVSPAGTVASAGAGTGTASAPLNARLSAVAPGAASVGNPCAGRQHCYNAGSFTAEVQLSAGGQRATVGLSLRNMTNQPIFLAYKGTTSQLRDNLGHALSLQQDPSGYQRPSRLNPGQGMPLGFAFNGGQGPLGTSFTYGVVIDQLQVLPNGQVQLVREYPLNFGGLMVPGAATPATKAAVSTATAPVVAAKKPAATPVTKKP